MEVLVCSFLLPTQASPYAWITPLIDNTVEQVQPEHQLFLSCATTTVVVKEIRSLYLFVTENTSLFEFSRSNTRNYALKASLDMVKLHWNCMILPSGCSTLESPGGSTSSRWILKVMAVSLLSLSLSLKEHELMAYWEYCFLSPGPYSTFPLLPLEMHGKAAHSMAKHTTRSCWCPWCLSICRP